jgi:hypothetical protein
LKPVKLEAFGEVHETRGSRRLDKIGARAEAIGHINIAGFARGTEDDNDEFGEGGFLLNPLEHFEAGDSRQLEIQQDEAGQGIFDAIAKLAGAAEVMDGLFAIRNNTDRIVDFRGAQCSREEVRIVFVILDQQNVPVSSVHHGLNVMRGSFAI